MGREVPAVSVSRRDWRAYREKVRTCLDVLGLMLRDARFEARPNRIGLEIEFHLVDDRGRPALTNAAVLAAISDPIWTTELGRFNLEANVPPRTVSADVFAALEAVVREIVSHAAKRAELTGSRLVMVGTLPTLCQDDVNRQAISANPRYQLLNDQILAARGEEMRISIDGPEPLLAHVDHILPEAACTSVQFHLQVSADSFASYWNAAQAVSGVQVALGANSPFLFGHELWRETRITLFEQAIDTRSQELKAQGVRPRVWFGDRWISSAFELFEENLRYFPPLLPLCEDEDPLAVLRGGGAPQLAELALHNGTIYRWNRPIYGVTDGKPHLRVENRVLPAGPTVTDMAANAAFFYGLIHELVHEERPVWSLMSFRAAAANLVAGARHGLDAEVYWPGAGQLPVTELALRFLLPLAASGLKRWGVDDTDASRLLSIIERRCLTKQNGASWQVAAVSEVQRAGVSDRHEALRLMTQGYIDRMLSGDPVHTWPGI